MKNFKRTQFIDRKIYPKESTNGQPLHALPNRRRWHPDNRTNKLSIV